MACWDLIADIGGTNARFARYKNDRICDIAFYSTKENNCLNDVVHHYLSKFTTQPERVMFCLAGMIRDGCVRLTNAKHSLNVASVRQITGGRSVEFINDFTAAAWALVDIAAADIICLQASAGRSKKTACTGNRLIIGPGTGLGVGMLIYANGGYKAVTSESGHSALAPRNFYEVDIFTALIESWPEVHIAADTFMIEAEALLSGTGLPYLYRAICTVAQTPAIFTDAQSILAAAKQDQYARTTLIMFKSHLGAFAGNLALTVSATGGVFITGGVANQNQWIFDAVFLNAFNNGGRFSATRKSIAVYLYKNENFGLIGVANALKFNR